jgi:hypothetical protein
VVPGLIGEAGQVRTARLKHKRGEMCL